MSDEVLKSFLDPRRLERFERIASLRTDSLTVVLDRVHKSHNISAVLRSCDAFGLRDVHVVGKLEISEGITLGTENWLCIHEHESPQNALDALRASGHAIAVTAPEEQESRADGGQAKSLPVFELPFERKIALVFGNEKEGVSPELFSAAEFHAFIPMFGFVESLNISVACAICLFASSVTIQGPARSMPLLPEDEQSALVSKWVKRNFSYSARVERELGRRRGARQ